VRLVHEVYTAVQKFGKYPDHGLPINYSVPKYPGIVISGLTLNDSVLIRRTDFGTNHEPLKILSGIKVITVNYSPGICNVLSV